MQAKDYCEWKNKIKNIITDLMYLVEQLGKEAKQMLAWKNENIHN